MAIHIDAHTKGRGKHVKNLATDLQCAMMGPASGGLQVFTLRRKARKGVGYSGTPWSGHAVNWN